MCKRELPMERFYLLGEMVYKDKVGNLAIIGMGKNVKFNFQSPSSMENK